MNATRLNLGAAAVLHAQVLAHCPAGASMVTIEVGYMRTLLSWSSGKDSAWALHRLRQQPDVTVVGLVTTINEAFDRVAMHGVRCELVEAQAEAAGLPLHVLPARFAGRRFDQALIDDLPSEVDPCAENGEFHTFASAGPMFTRPIRVEGGEIVTRDGFVFADLVRAGGHHARANAG